MYRTLEVQVYRYVTSKIRILDADISFFEEDFCQKSTKYLSAVRLVKCTRVLVVSFSAS
jgi:hypothetical protein